MEDLTNRPEPMALKSLLKERNIRLWQLIRRLASKGIRTTEPRLSRILSGIEEPSDQVRAELEAIEDSLINFDYTKKAEKGQNETATDYT